MENERTGGRAGGKRIDERADFGALRNGIAACVVAIHCVHALYTAFPTIASFAGEVKGHFISPQNGIRCLVCVSVCQCVSVSVYLSVPALAASASVEDSKQRYSRVSLRLFLDFDSWIFEKPFRSKVIARKSQNAN